MFKLKPDPTFWMKVSIPVPGSSQAPLELECKHRTRSELDELVEELAARDNMSRKRLQKVLEQTVVGWRGADSEFSAEALRQAAQNYPGFADQVLTDYLQELRGTRPKDRG